MVVKRKRAKRDTSTSSARGSPSGGKMIVNGQAIVSVANINEVTLFKVCSNLNKRFPNPTHLHDIEGKSCNLLDKVRLGIGGYTLQQIAPLVNIIPR